jgi:general L-amino acid transport system permease protein
MTTALKRSFASPLDALTTLVVAILAAVMLIPLGRWAIVDAVWRGTPGDCRAEGAGACWAFVGHKLRFLLFGLYPIAQQWRPAVVLVLLLALIALTARPELWRKWLLVTWLVCLTVAAWLMGGGFGLPRVPTRQWGGLPITLVLTATGLAGGFPIAILLALGRRSRLRVPRWIATVIVEVVRGIPLIAVLYLAALVLPLTLPRGFEPDKLLLAQAGIALFAAAYLAEAVRAGLQSIPRGQTEAALALGLRRWHLLRHVVLPQALRIVIPAFVSIAVGFFQDTSLVVIIGLFDLLNTARLAAQDPVWLGFYTEAYVFAGLIFFAGSGTLSRYGLWLERRINPARR